MQPVQTCRRRGEPLTMARTRWMFGFQRRFVRRCEWLMLMPNEGCLPHTSQTAAMTRPSTRPNRELGKVSIRAHDDCPGRYRRDDMTLPRLAAADLRQAVIGYRDLLRV